ncbi:Por secretion system C-terminal sorting domain-containing protein [Siphonobacter aquaeclarae]|uniref:Por secretion system C-terminal sorting domain-containing protein n=1 Tax=Siphonobacter aquaeclarae TaxID=563176 RepID=A0A1G9YNV0_9BACT|nr:Por secretion system C-terminal sorting domain-containing protein [Siphonobacter aquaeclarae]
MSAAGQPVFYIPWTRRLGWIFRFRTKLLSVNVPMMLICVALATTSVPLWGQVFPSVQWQKVYGGSEYELEGSIIRSTDGHFFAIGASRSNDGDVPDNGHNFPNDFFLVKAGPTGQKIWSRAYGSSWYESASDMVPTTDGGGLVVGFVYKDYADLGNFEAGDMSDPGQIVNDGSYNGWMVRVDGNGNKLWDLRVGESSSSAFFDCVTPTPDGGFLLGGDKDGSFWLVKVNGSGQKVWEKKIGNNLPTYWHRIVSVSTGGYLLGCTTDNQNLERTGPGKGSKDIWLVRIDEFGNKLWDKSIGDVSGVEFTDLLATKDGGFAVLAGSSSTGKDRTAAGGGSLDYWLVKLDGAGNIQWDVAYGTTGYDDPTCLAQASDGSYFIGGRSYGGISGDKTDPSPTSSDWWIVKLAASGTKIWDKTVGNNDNYNARSGSLLAEPDGGVIMAVASDAPVGRDKVVPSKGKNDIWVFKLGCAYSTETVQNNISPATQTACILGTPTVITGTDDDNLYPDHITYQWQRSSNGVDGWSDLSVGVNKDYLPEPSANTLYYRRIARWECHADTSNTAVVTIDARQAPGLTMGGPYATCAGSPIALGHTPPASGGTAPYTYAWDNAGLLDDAAKANPIATLSASSVLTLTVTDAAGCRKTDQAIVNIPPSALAGPDVSLCPGGQGVRIGKDPLLGFGAVTYTWTPATGLDNPGIARPLASPTAPTTYTLTVTYTNSDGQPCSVTDQVVVSVAAAPAAGFAGPDKTICSGTTAILGTVGQPGFTYTWSPGIYLQQNNAAQVTFNPGTVFPPIVDPIRYTVTATDGTCTYTDDVIATVIRADAGLDGCGPRLIGTVDLTPNVNESYSWVRMGLSNGSGNFTGATNLPRVPVSGTASGADVYELAVSHGGTTCRDTVVVPICGNCGVDFIAEGGNCLVYNGKPLRLIADAGGSDEFVYTWSPAAGLSATTGPIVYLLDGVNRTYTLTKSRVSNPMDACSISKVVNPPAASYPVFSAPDVAACAGTTVTIGSPTVSGYVYSWTGPGGFASSSSSPSLTVAAETAGVYQVKVEDTNPGNPFGCFTTGSVNVSLETVVAPQDNWIVCENALIKLGAPDPSSGRWSYSWTPAVAAWQNGTGPSSAQPEVLVTTNTTFSVTVTNPSGCTATANSTVTVTNSPTITNAADITDACPGSSVRIGSPALPGVTYSWSPATGLDNPAIAQPLATVGGAGSSVTYTVTATFPGSCSATAIDQVTVSAFNPGINLGPDIVYCPSAGPVAIGSGAPTTGVSSYSWTPATGLNNATLANPTTTVTVPTEYTLTVTYTNGCVGSAHVKVIPSSAPNAGSDRTICYGSSTQLGSPGNDASATWSGPGTTYLSSLSGPVVTFNGNGTAPAGTYTFTATQTVNGCTNADQVTITVAAPVTAASGSATVCLGGTGVIGTVAAPGYNYEWVPSTGLSSPFESNPQITLSTPGLYSYVRKVTSIATGCVASGEYRVTVLPTSAPVVSVPNVAACLATPLTLAASISPTSGNYSYSWSPATDLSNPYILAPTVAANSTRTYTLSVTDQATGCSSQSSGTVTVDYLDGNYITAGPESVAGCPNSPVTFTASVSDGFSYQYQWQKLNSSATAWEDISDGGLYSGAHTLTLHISDNTTLNGVRFRIVVTTTSCGVRQESSFATLTVNQCQKSSLGDRVWDDTDRDGTQDAGEPGVSGVSVTLYRNGVLLTQTVTDQNGNYLFDNLDAYDPFGQLYTYEVGFTNLPGGYVFTMQGADAGSNGAGSGVDSDVNVNTGRSRSVTLSYNQYLPDVDAGIHSNTPLPVTLISFTGRSNQCAVELFWTVAEEKSFSHYEILYSPNGEAFEVAGRVAAAGSNSRYTFRPAQTNGTAYYRLRMVDLDGTASLSRILSFVTDCRELIRFYPNPAAESVQFTGQKRLKKVTIYDGRGEVVGVFSNILSGEKLLVGNLPGGFYLLKGETEEGQEFSGKLVINK